MNMRTYKEYSPTGFDPSGAFLPDRQSWLVAPAGQTRDSGCLDQSNFAQFLEAVGGESETVEVHRFGYWGPGWFEIILIDPANESAVKAAEDCEAALADYPILNEEDYSARQWNRAGEYWAQCSIHDRVDMLRRFHGNIFEARRDSLPQSDNGELISYLAE